MWRLEEGWEDMKSWLEKLRLVRVVGVRRGDSRGISKGSLAWRRDEKSDLWGRILLGGIYGGEAGIMSSIASFLKKVRLPQFSFLEKPTVEVPILYTDKSTLSPGLPREVHYVTPRLLLMPFPEPDLLPTLALFLNTQFGKRYMIWNLSERTYDNAPFGGQVIDYVFVGYPNPPLDMLFATCTSIQAWLNTDPGNVAVVHCQATRSRSVMTLACFLAWNSQEFLSAMQALVKICGTVGISESKLLFPSQKRYMQYSEIILAGTMVSPKQPVSRKLRFERAIITGIPAIESEGASIRPYIQLFKGTTMVFSSGSE